ncbi:MAG: hypothetical protein NTW86_15925 [Candidatus Sumerlaeota bacterium]|nr:hypothetical protein [Candidatus Sumerlaeota bacterium]
MRPWIARFVVAALLTAVCPAARADFSVLHYLRDRAWDLTDLVRLRIGLPKDPASAGLHVRATRLLEAGAVRFDGTMVGMDRRAFGVLHEERTELGASVVYYSQVITDVRHGNQFTDVDSDWSRRRDRGIVRNYKGWDDGRHHPFSLGLEIEFPFLPGIDIGLYPEELGDFVLGFVGVDLYDDDKTDVVKREKKEFKEEHRQSISNEDDFTFPQSFDDALAPYEYPNASAPATNGKSR